MSPRDTAPVTAGRLVAVDMLKGCAALWVLMIHAEVLRGQPLMTHVFNRAAQLFVILIGLNSSLWWRNRDRAGVRAWYGNRLRRLYPPMWAAVACWWALALWLRPTLRVALGPRLLAEHASGYLVGIGTGWFVSYAIATALLFPIFLWSERRIGRWALLVVGVSSTVASFLFLRRTVMESAGLFGWLVFPPRLFAHVAFGIFLAPIVDRLGKRAVLWSALALALYFVAPLIVGVDASWNTREVEGLALTDLSGLLYVLTDLPVCVLLLVALDALRQLPALVVALGWLGHESYAIYLGQMVLHNAIGFGVGFYRFRGVIGAWGYAALLLAGSLGWVVATLATRSVLARLRPLAPHSHAAA